MELATIEVFVTGAVLMALLQVLGWGSLLLVIWLWLRGFRIRREKEARKAAAAREAMARAHAQREAEAQAAADRAVAKEDAAQRKAAAMEARAALRQKISDKAGAVFSTLRAPRLRWPFIRASKRLFYLGSDGVPRGPVDENQLQELVNQGVVTGETLICPEKGEHWDKLTDLVA